MKKQLLFAMLFGALGMNAQSTHMINWGLGQPTAQFSKTINAGDTVLWTWTSAHPHTVTSLPGSAETFTSAQLTGIGQTYSKVFTVVGTNPYICNVHAGMTGTITVQSVAGVDDRAGIIDFESYPNPVTDMLTINAPQLIDRLQIFDMQGKLIVDAAVNNPTAKIYMNNYTAGTYFVKVTAGQTSKTLAVVKK